MEIYHYDENKIFLGSSEAQLDPLELRRKGKQVFLIPRNATAIKPPAPVPGKEAKFISEEAGWQLQDIPKPKKITLTTSKKIDAIEFQKTVKQNFPGAIIVFGSDPEAAESKEITIDVEDTEENRTKFQTILDNHDFNDIAWNREEARKDIESLPKTQRAILKVLLSSLSMDYQTFRADVKQAYDFEA